LDSSGSISELIDTLQNKDRSHPIGDKFRLAKEKIAEIKGLDSLGKGNLSEEDLVAP
jgi:hypothetical protein